jgi:glucose-6-phosphate 1-dehydrogenase
MIKPFYLVIFGGDGDLALRKIYPAIFQRFKDGQLDIDFRIICITRKNSQDETLNKITAISAAKEDQELFGVFIKHIEIVSIPENTEENYLKLKLIVEKNSGWQRVFYFSVPSSAYSDICNTLKQTGLLEKSSKVVLEKPLGFDLQSSKKINNIISTCFKEHQIFRIDHYLGKETVQNLMVLRFANHLFENAWSGNHIESIQITVSESIGVEQRGGYYDKTGALLDMVQNHLLQLLCLVAMEPPASLDADSVRNEKLKVLQSLRFFNDETISGQVVRGQYTRGSVEDTHVNSYLEDINEYSSETETFVAIRAYIDNWRWKNTPIYLRTGKRMKKRYSDIVINFKEIPHNIFPDTQHALKNKLIIRLQPEERIELVQLSKIPGPGGYRFKPISLKLDFVDSFDERMPDAYERLIIDVLRGDQTLFMRHDELEAAWKWIESITNNWKNLIPLALYESGTWGPGDQILEPGVQWQTR